MRAYLGFFIFAMLIGNNAFAREQTTPANQEQPVSVSQDSTAQSQEDLGPVPVPEATEKAMRYYRSGNLLWWVNTIWGLLIPALFLFTCFSAIPARDSCTNCGALRIPCSVSASIFAMPTAHGSKASL